MTDFSQLLVADRGRKARAVHIVDKDSFGDWVKGRSAEDRALLDAHRFDGKTGYARATCSACRWEQSGRGRGCAAIPWNMESPP